MTASMRGTGLNCSWLPSILAWLAACLQIWHPDPLASWPSGLLISWSLGILAFWSPGIIAPRFSLFQQKYKSLEGNSGFLLLDTKERQRLHSLLSISPTTIPEVSTASLHSTHQQVQVEGKVEEDIPENADVTRLRVGAGNEEFLLRRRPAVVEDRPVRQQEAVNPPM